MNILHEIVTRLRSGFLYDVDLDALSGIADDLDCMSDELADVYNNGYMHGKLAAIEDMGDAERIANEAIEKMMKIDTA